MAGAAIAASARAQAPAPPTALRYDLVIRGGEVVDPSQNLRARRDVAIRNALVAAVEPEIPAAEARQSIDATGKLVCPGLVDLHAHVYPEVSAIGLPADELVPWTATTTYVSAGDAGANTFSLFRHAVAARSRTRLFGFVHVSSIGLAGFPVAEMLNIDYAAVEAAAKTVAENRDICLGVKVRVSADVVGGNGLEPLRRAIRAAELAGPWAKVMCHIGNAPGDLGELLNLLRPGDILTHAFSGAGNNTVQNGRVLPAALEAKRRGVVVSTWATAAGPSTTRCSSRRATGASARTPSAATCTRCPATRRDCPSCPG
jgi:dihydroorotase